MINKDKWAESIKDFQEKKLPSLYRREIEIPTERPVKRAVSIIGPRRSGKTYEMYLLIRKLVEKYNKKRILYVNFERADLGLVKREDLVKMKEVYYELFPEFKDKEVWFFLDEIQNVDGWEKFVRTCLDEEINVYLSGSSSKMLSQEIATSMRGRNLPYKILPFSFREFLDTKNIDYKNHLSSKQKSNIKNLFNKYLKFGGYPEVIIHRKEREKILKDIYDTALYRDVVDRANIRNTKVMELLINALVKSKEFSVNKFYNFLKSSNIKASKNSLYNYIGYLNDAFIVYPLKKFEVSYKKKEQSIPKIYFVDNGLLTLNGVDDKGRLLENLVFVDLLRKKGYENLAYYQTTKEEVDFLVLEGKKVRKMIQVCYDYNENTKERELTSLVNASKKFDCDNLLLITSEKDETVEYNNKKINLLPCWKWLISDTK